MKRYAILAQEFNDNCTSTSSSIKIQMNAYECYFDLQNFADLQMDLILKRLN